MVPAGRGYYQVMAKVGDFDSAKADRKGNKSGCRKRTESDRVSESESATESRSVSESVSSTLLTVKKETIEIGNGKKDDNKDGKKDEKKGMDRVEKKDGKKAEKEDVKKAVRKHIKKESKEC